MNASTLTLKNVAGLALAGCLGWGATGIGCAAVRTMVQAREATERRGVPEAGRARRQREATPSAKEAVAKAS